MGGSSWLRNIYIGLVMTICSMGCKLFTVDSSLLLSNVLLLAISVWLYICYELYTSVSVS